MNIQRVTYQYEGATGIMYLTVVAVEFVDRAASDLLAAVASFTSQCQATENCDLCRSRESGHWMHAVQQVLNVSWTQLLVFTI